MLYLSRVDIFFFFNDTATTEIYTLSLHDALPILVAVVLDTLRGASHLSPPVVTALVQHLHGARVGRSGLTQREAEIMEDRKSTRLNSSHSQISYAVFCLKKKINHYTCSPSNTLSY